MNCPRPEEVDCGEVFEDRLDSTGEPSPVRDVACPNPAGCPPFPVPALYQGGAGDDWFRGHDEASAPLTVFDGGADDDKIDSFGADQFRGGEGKDTLIGGGSPRCCREARGLEQAVSEDQELYGDGGRDSIVGGTGDDLIDGGEGDDCIAYCVDTARDELCCDNREAGDDVFLTGEGADLILTGPGDDEIRDTGAADEGPGHDIFIGGGGNDSLSYPGRSEPIVIDIAPGGRAGADLNRDGASSEAEEGDVVNPNYCPEEGRQSGEREWCTIKTGSGGEVITAPPELEKKTLKTSGSTATTRAQVTASFHWAPEQSWCPNPG